MSTDGEPSIAGASQRSRSTIVQNDGVLRGPELARYWLLTATAALALVSFTILWIPLVWTGPARAISAMVTVCLLAQLAAWAGRWMPLRLMARPRPLPPASDLRVAAVTTIVSGAESRVMMEETARAMLGMERPHDTWILDEDDAPDVRAFCARLGIRHFSRRHRPEYQTENGTFRTGSKHGNYNAWLTEHGYEGYDILVGFDPDHVPERNYLARVLGFFRDPTVAFVQPPQVYYNQDASFVARGAAEETYAYYSSHLMASYAVGHSIVIGSHTAHRLTALRAVGGFPAHDGEDLYLTMLYRAAGWRGVFVPEILAMGTTPVDWPSYLAQQLRWSRAVIDLKLRVFPKVAGRLPPLEQALNLLHGSLYLRPLLVPVLYLALIVALVLGVVPGVLTPQAVALTAGLVVCLTLIGRFRERYYLDRQHEGGVAWRPAALQLAKWPVFVTALRDALIGRGFQYVVTRKTSNARARQEFAAPVQFLVAAVVVLAWLAGFLRNGTIPVPLTVCALVVVAATLAVGWLERRTPVASFTPGLHQQRRRAMTPPDAVPVVTGPRR